MGLIKALSIGVGVKSNVKKGLKTATKDVSSWASRVSSVATGTVIADVAAGAVSKGLAGLSSTISTALNFAIRDEKLEVAFATLLGGADKAKKVLGDLREFGASTPFEFPALADAGKKLISFGFSQKSLIPEMKKLGDVAAGLDIPFSDLADIYGKARVQGKIMSEDLNQLAGRGIPVFDELAKVMGVPAGEIKKLASTGKIEFADLQKTFTNMTGEGGRFSGMMAAQSQTAGGLISTLRDNINLKLGQIGAAIFKTFDIKGLINRGIGYIQAFTPTLNFLIEQATKLRPVFQQTFNVVSSIFVALWKVASSVVTSIGSLFGDFGSVSMDGFVHGMVEALATVEFAFQNWEKIADLAIHTLAHGMVVFGNDVTHLFTKTIPAVFAWWSENGLDVMMNLTANALTLFENLGSNIVNVFSNIGGLINGSVNLDDLLTPLNDGMLKVVQKAIELPVRVEGGVEKLLREDLERLQNELGAGLDATISKRLDELIPADSVDPAVVPPIEVVTPEIDPNLGNKVAQQFAGLAERGSQEYQDAILRFRGLGNTKDKLQKDQVDLSKQQLAELKKANKRNKPAPVQVSTIG